MVLTEAEEAELVNIALAAEVEEELIEYELLHWKRKLIKAFKAEQKS